MAIAKKSILEQEIYFKNGSIVQLAFFSKNLALMLRSGLDIIEALDIIREQSKGKFRLVIDELITSVESGNPLSDALKKFHGFFSDLFINTVLAGEKSGTLTENLENIAGDLEKSNAMYTKIRTAMVYPITLLGGAIILMAIMAFVVLPKIIPMFENMNVDLPWSTRMLIYITHFVENNRQVLMITVFGGMAFLFWFCTRRFARPITHYFLLHFPIVKNLVISSNLANYCHTLGTMLKSGLIIDEALAISRDVVGNYYFRKSLDDVYKRTLQGNRLSENLERHRQLFPPMVISMIKVGERSGNLETSLFHLADYYERELDNTTKNLSTAIEPIMLIGIGLIVGLLAISIITPIYKLTGNASYTQ
jgi:type IV pilus assembly protein PilC